MREKVGASISSMPETAPADFMGESNEQFLFYLIKAWLAARLEQQGNS